VIAVSRTGVGNHENAGMRAAAVRFRADLRDRWRSWTVLVVLVGLFAGAVIAIAAGARRTDSALARFEHAERAPDEMVFTPPDAGETFARLSPARIRRLPDVTATASLDGYLIENPADLSLIAPTDGALGTRLLRKKILAGRDVDPNRADEVTISFVLAHDHHLHVGDELHVAAQRGTSTATQPLTFRIVGIDAAPTEFPPQSGEGVETAWTTAAFARRAGDLAAFHGLAIELRTGAKGAPRFEGEVAKLAGQRVPQLFALADQSVNTQHSIHLQAIALWMLALLLALAGALVIGQLVARQARLEADEYPTLRSLGMTTGELFAVGALRVLTIGVLGAAVAVVFAVAASPLLPVGLARIAEPHPGFAVDAVAIGLGVLATVAAVFLISAWSVAREAGARAGGRHRVSTPRLRALVGRASAPAVAIGMTFALEQRRGKTSVPVRTTVIGAAVGLVALVTALSFSASLDHLLATPRLYGVTFDAYVTSLGNNDVGAAMPTVRATPDVDAVALGYAGVPFALDGHRVDGMAFASPRGNRLSPIPSTGRVPNAPDEIMLGTRTMAKLHAHVGSIVAAQIERGRPREVRVVGSGVFPTLSDQLGFGNGAMMTTAGLRRTLGPVPPPPPDHLFVGFRRGAPRDAIGVLSRRVERVGGVAVLPVQRPTDLVNFGRVQSLPIVLASILVALAALTMTHLLVTSIQRHRTELAVLRAMGCAPAQVRRTVSVQATTLAALALAVGIPIGLLTGRLVWHLFARGLGIASHPSAPTLALAILVPGTLVVANLTSYLPGRAAARAPVASILRTE
jgi:hypothetical protein